MMNGKANREFFETKSETDMMMATNVQSSQR